MKFRKNGKVDLRDKRLETRAVSILNALESKPLETIRVACQGSAETKTAYRFFDNDKRGCQSNCVCAVDKLLKDGGRPPWSVIENWPQTTLSGCY